MPALGEVASELAAVLRSVVHDVGHDEPSWPREVCARPPRLGHRGIVEGFHEGPKARVLFEAERVDGREIVEREPLIPHVGISNVVSDAELAPAPVHVDDMPERLEGAAVVEIRRPPELLVRQAGRRRQDPVVRPCVESDEGEHVVCIHVAILGPWEPCAARERARSDPHPNVSPLVGKLCSTSRRRRTLVALWWSWLLTLPQLLAYWQVGNKRRWGWLVAL